jgi:hypothetical protein
MKTEKEQMSETVLEDRETTGTHTLLKGLSQRGTKSPYRFIRQLEIKKKNQLTQKSLCVHFCLVIFQTGFGE